jgi:hypothetical protein
MTSSVGAKEGKRYELDVNEGHYPNIVNTNYHHHMADGSKKAVKEITTDDAILTYNFFTGETEAKDVALVVNHGVAEYPVANLTFSDGTVLKIIAEHGIFDYDLNKFVYITADNMNEYVGHRFVKYAADGSYNVVTFFCRSFLPIHDSAGELFFLGFSRNTIKKRIQSSFKSIDTSTSSGCATFGNNTYTA